MHATDARATTLLVLILALLPGTAARAQTPPAATAPGKAIPTPDQLEPGVDTTRSTPSAAPQAPAPAPAPLSAPPAAASSRPAQPRGDGCDG
jgi:hypothetical protein